MNHICYKLSYFFHSEEKCVIIKPEQINILRAEYFKMFGCSISEKSIDYDIYCTKQYGFVEVLTVNWSHLIQVVDKKITFMNEINNSIEKVLA